MSIGKIVAGLADHDLVVGGAEVAGQARYRVRQWRAGDPVYYLRLPSGWRTVVPHARWVGLLFRAMSVTALVSLSLFPLGCGDGEGPSEPGTAFGLPPQERPAPLVGDHSTATVVVSLTFDDGFASQSVFLDILEENGIDSLFGTFYVNSSRLNLEINERESRDHVRYAPLDLWLAAAEAGHEIGSHSVSHPDLTCTQERLEEGACQPGHEAITAKEQRRQVCGDREMLMALGFDVAGFAYPFGRNATGDESTHLHDVVASCGFAYARGTSGLSRGKMDDSSEPLAESLPPENPYAIRSYDSLTEDVTLDDVRGWILDARAAGGGWVPLLLHHITDDCRDTEEPGSMLGVCTRREELEKLVRWLARAGADEGEAGAPDDVATATVGQVMKELGSTKRHLVANGTMEEPHSGSVARPNCFDRFGGRHDGNFEWSSADIERERQDAGEPGDPDGARGYFEKLIPTPSRPTPFVQMTTRDDRCYLAVVEGGRYQARLRARAFAANGQEVRGRFVARVLRVSALGGSVDPTWSDWITDGDPGQLLRDEWQVHRLNLPPIPESVVALAFGYQYVTPAPSDESGSEIWLDDFELLQFD